MAQDTYFRHTLERIDQIANEDVEMQAPLLEGSTFLVLDTNILLHYFDVMTQFVDDVDNHTFPIVVVVPGVVIQELDAQKNRDGLAWLARRASAWLLKKVRERKTVKCQANEETCKPSKNWKVRGPGEDWYPERRNDELIVDCCRYFRRGRPTYLCSADKLLCADCERESTVIPTIEPTKKWSSRDIACAIFEGLGIQVDISGFGTYRVSYKDLSNVSTRPIVSRLDEDGDRMDVDDDGSAGEIMLPSHALDLLHLQVIEHFERLLIELVIRVGGSEVINPISGGSSASRYAPPWKRGGKVTDWTAAECLEYLDSKKKIGVMGSRIEVFLSRPYSSVGARRGQDWSRRDWEVCLEALGTVGDAWMDGSLRESLAVLAVHVRGIFGLKMRPTGI